MNEIKNLRILAYAKRTVSSQCSDEIRTPKDKDSLCENSYANEQLEELKSSQNGSPQMPKLNVDQIQRQTLDLLEQGPSNTERNRGFKVAHNNGQMMKTQRTLVENLLLDSIRDLSPYKKLPFGLVDETQRQSPKRLYSRQQSNEAPLKAFELNLKVS